MKNQFEIHKVTRENILKCVQDLSDEQLNKIPEGFNNNILWNMGHIVSSTQRLCYANSSLPLRVPENMPLIFGKGTNPKQWEAIPDVKSVKEYLVSTVTLLEQDCEDGIFHEYKGYLTSYGFEIKNIHDAIAFCNVHEALHFGVILTLKKLV